ncbi:MAG: hypothetical protein J6M24_04125 [Lachnospiraceae bacterium]|nr:hypothetical protein [Lachnospiraceae bacterium]
MKKKKGVIAFVMVLILSLSMFAACGSEKARDNDENIMSEANMKADIAAIDSIDDAFKLLGNYEEGSFEYSFHVKSSSEAENVPGTDAKIKLYGDAEEGAMNASADIDIKSDGIDISKKFENAVCLKDERLYLNLGEILSELTGTQAELGSFGILMPETDSKEAQIYYGEILELSSKFFSAACEGLEVEKSTGKYYVHIKGANDVKKAIENILEWLENNKDDVVDLIYASKDYGNVVDLKKYASALIDEYYDDIIESARLIAAELGKGNNFAMVEMMLGSKDDLKKQLETYIDEAYSQVDDSLDKNRLAKETDEFIAGAKKKFAETADTWKEKYPYLEKTDLSIGIELDSDTYTLVFSGVVPSGKCLLNIDASAKYVQKQVDIEKPGNEMRLPEIVRYVIENKDKLSNALESVRNAGFDKRKR